MFSLTRSQGTTTLYLSFRSNPVARYEISEFDIEFSQPTDHKGVPQHEMQGGIITFNLVQLPDKWLNSWMLRSNDKRSGEFTFTSEGQSVPLRIEFINAYCVNYRKDIGSNNAGMRFQLTISAMEVSLNGMMHINEWKNI